MRPATAKPRKQPLQSRSKETFGAILEAAARILEAEGLEAANTNAIAARAGVSIGSLYQYFPDKAAIFAELIRQAETGLGDMLEKLLAHAAGQSLEDRLKLLIKAGVAQQMSRPQLGRILDYLEATLPADATLKAADERILRLIMQLLKEHEEGIARPVSPATALDVLSIFKGIVDGASFAGETNAAALESRVMFALLGYLKQP
ncbi:MAG: TetR/AcrR family transcriptional regulator [Roseomonas sp.]|nr:TetR/AcrR family transcriptional regulator [Roseomonas sp.]